MGPMEYAARRPSTWHSLADEGPGDLAGDIKLPAFSYCREESILLFLCQAPNTRSKMSNDSLRHCL